MACFRIKSSVSLWTSLVKSSVSLWTALVQKVQFPYGLPSYKKFGFLMGCLRIKSSVSLRTAFV